MSYQYLTQYVPEEHPTVKQIKGVPYEAPKGLEKSRETYYLTKPRVVQPIPGSITQAKFEKETGVKPDLPEEAVITKVTKTKEGYQIEYVEPTKPEPQPTWQTQTLAGAISQKGLVGLFASLLAPMLPEEKRQRYLESMGVVSKIYEPKVVPISSKTFAGFIAGPEKYYRMVRGEPAPPMPISGAIGFVLGSPEELKQLEEAGTQYGVGALFWELGEAYVVGKAVEKAFVGVKKLVPESVKHAVKFGRVAKTTYKAKLAFKEVLPTPGWAKKIDVWLAQHSRWYYAKTGGIASGEVAYGQMPLGITMGKPVGYKVPIEKLAQYSLGTERAFQFQIAPRTGGVWVKGAPAVSGVQTYVFETVIRGGVIKQVFRPARIEEFIKTPIFRQYPKAPLRETWFKKSTLPMFEHRGLLPYVTQTQLTRMGIFPYIPKMTVSTGKKAMSTFGIGLGTTTALKIFQPPTPKRKVKPKKKLISLPFEWQPTYTFEKEKFRPLTIETVEPKKKERKAVVPKLVTPQLPSMKTLQKQVQALKVPEPTPIKAPAIPAFPPLVDLGGGGRGRGADRTRFAKWWRKQQQIKTPKQMLKTYFDDKPIKKVMEIF